MAPVWRPGVHSNAWLIRYLSDLATAGPSSPAAISIQTSASTIAVSSRRRIPFRASAHGSTRPSRRHPDVGLTSSPGHVPLRAGHQVVIARQKLANVASVDVAPAKPVVSQDHA